MGILTPFGGQRGNPSAHSADAYIKAAGNLYHHLHKGFSWTGVQRVPIAGDTTRLPFATGLSPLERRMARAQNFLAQHFGGTPEVRQLMGHVQFGARICYGDYIFFTISPNELHSGLVLRLSRFRLKDPSVKFGDAAFKKGATQTYPSLEEARRMAADATDYIEIDVPGYDQ